MEGDPPGRELIPAILDGGFHAVLRLLDRAFGKAHRGKGGKAQCDVNLHLDHVGVDPKDGAAQNSR